MVCSWCLCISYFDCVAYGGVRHTIGSDLFSHMTPVRGDTALSAVILYCIIMTSYSAASLLLSITYHIINDTFSKKKSKIACNLMIIAL